jgi:hypothetical protein
MKKQKMWRIVAAIILFLTTLSTNLNGGKVKGETLNIPEYMEYTKAQNNFMYQWKNKTFLVVEDNTRTNTRPGEFPTNLKFIMLEKGKEKLITIDNKLMPSYYSFIGVYNNELYYKSTNFNDNYREYINKINLDTLVITKVMDAPYSKTLNLNDFKRSFIKRIIMDKSGNFTFIREYSSMKLDGEDYLVIIKDNREYALKTRYLSERPEFMNQVEVSDSLVDNQGNIWIECFKIYDKKVATVEAIKELEAAYKSGQLKDETYIQKIDFNNKVTKYDISNLTDMYGVIAYTFFDKDNNVWAKTYDYIDGISKTDILKLKFQDTNVAVMERLPLIDVTQMIEDNNGVLWAIADGTVMKYENGKMITKYKAYNKFSNERISVYDDENLVVYGDQGYIIISKTGETESDKKTSATEQKPNEQKTRETEQKPDEEKTELEKPKYELIVSNDKANVITKMDSTQLLKNGENLLDVTSNITMTSLAVGMEADKINGGSGNLSISTNILAITMPFSIVDYENAGQGATVNFKYLIKKDDSSLNSLKSIGKVFDFSFTTNNSSESLIKDIHKFKSGKVKVAVKLSEEEIKTLDTTKLSACYFNENTQRWEVIGGNFNKDNLTFTFETDHFSKFTIGYTEVVLPQTGAFIDEFILAIIALVCISLGLILVKKDRLLRV